MIARQLIFGFLIAFGAIYAPNVFAIEHSLSQLKSLQPGNIAAIENYAEVSTIAMLYQPGCKWCKKQGKLLANIQKSCGAHANIALVGADGNTQKLKRELRHFDKNLPAFEANKKFLRKIKGIEAFPTTVVFDKKGKLIAKKRGYIEPQKLAQVLGVLTNQRCNIVL